MTLHLYRRPQRRKIQRWRVRRLALIQRLFQLSPKDWITGVLGNSLPPQKRQMAEIQITGPPSQQGGIQGQYARTTTTGLRAPTETSHQLIGLAPVHRKPASHISHDSRT